MEQKVIEEFIAAINEQNLPQIIEKMAEDFQFIDTYGDREGKEAMKLGWQGYFEWFPDYRIEIDDYAVNERFTMIIGKASGSCLGKPENHWAFPAAWKVETKGQQIKTWQVFCDSKKQLDSMKEDSVKCND